MSSILRQSSNLARVSFQIAGRSCVRIPSRARLLPCRVYAQEVRTYATEPEESKDVRSKKKAEDSKKAVPEEVVKKPTKSEKKIAKPSRPAPGTENLYDQNTPLNTGTEEQPKESSKLPELPEGWVHMSAEEESELRKMIRANDKPSLSRDRLEKQVDWMKKEGMPIELRELLGSEMDKPPSLAKIQKYWRVLSKVADKQTDIERDRLKSGQDGGIGGQVPPGAGGPRGQSPKGIKAELKFDLQSFLIAVFVSYLLYRMVIPGENGKDITYQEFRAHFLEKGLVEKLTVEGNRVRVELNREATQSVYPDSPAINSNFYYYFSIGSIDSFERNLDAAQEELGIPVAERIPISYTSAHPSDLFNLLINFGPTLLLLGSLWFATRGASKGAGGNSGIFGMGKSRAKQFNHETDVKVKFKDVAGMDEAKLEIMEFVSFLKTPEKFQRLGAKIPRGAILSGPPGTGKTLLAKATAGESQVPFFSVSGSEFVEMFVGVGASRVRDLFAMARKSTPCIIFIDEIDAIGKARGKGVFGGNDEREATLNQILTEMDGFNTQEQVVVLAGTNRADVLDKALMRPGRFDRHIAIDRPTMEGRKQIFLVHLGKIVTNEDMQYLSGRLSALTPGFSGADIANCVNEAALIAARSSAKSVVMTHFEQAIERVVGGLEKKSLVLSSEERKTVAYHEAGHAICGWFFKHADPLLKVSIIPRGQGALGYAQYIPASDVYLMNVNQLMDRMAMTLGGRISEELHFETVTSGASDDFNKVTRMATAMVTKWGMSKKLGPLHFEDDENRMHKPFAESTAQMIDAEVSRIVHEAYKQCRELLMEKKKQVGVVAEELLKKEMLDRNDMVRLLGPREWDENKEFVKYFGPGGEKSAPPPFPGEGGGVEGGSAVM